jgi:hypothetical protein
MKYQAINTYGGVEVYLFIYLKFTLRRFPSNSDYIVSNERMKGELWIGKEVEGNGCGLI